MQSYPHSKRPDRGGVANRRPARPVKGSGNLAAVRAADQALSRSFRLPELEHES